MCWNPSWATARLWVRNCRIRVSALACGICEVYITAAKWDDVVCTLCTDIVYTRVAHTRKSSRRSLSPLDSASSLENGKKLNFPLHIKDTNTKWHLVCGCVLWVMKWDTHRFWLLVWCRFGISTALQKTTAGNTDEIEYKLMYTLNPLHIASFKQTSNKKENLPISLQTATKFCRVK